MKKLLLIVMFMTALFQGFSQTKGISYQAVILSPTPQEIPGVDAQRNILANSTITIQFTIVDASGSEVFQEYHTTSTDRYGMINLSIGNGTTTYSSFNDIVWDGTTKKLKVGIDFSGGSNFSPLSEQNLSYMPQPVSNETAQIINGNTTAITAIETNQTTQNSAIALNTAKVGITTAQATTISNTTGVNTGDQDISGIATNATNISSNDTDIATNVTAIALNTAKVGITTAQATTISNTTGVNTGDQDLTSFAALASPSFTGTVTISTLVAGSNSYPTTVGSANQVLATNGSGTLSWATPSTTATAYSGVLPVANGGTGSSTQNFVDLTTAQTVAGAKTFSSNASFNGQTIGKGNATGGENLAVGTEAMNGASTGVRNTAIGNSAMQNYVGTSFDNNTSVGYANLKGMTTGSGNTSVGAESMMALTTGTENTSVGNQSLINTTGNNNVGIGKRAGQTISTGSQNTIIGTDSDVATNSLSNATAIGYGAIVSASNKVQIGNADVTNVKTSGTLTAGAITIPNTDGTSGQVLSTNGSGALSWTNAPTGTVSSLSDLSVTATASELNILDGVTATATELNIIDGVTATTAELNIMDGSATTQATVTLVGTDGIVISDGDIMKKALMSDIKTYVEGGSGVTHNQVVIDSWDTPATELAIGDLKFRVDNGYLEWKSNTGSSINFDMEVTLKKDGSASFNSFPTTPKVGHASSEIATTSWAQVVGSSVGGSDQSAQNNVGLWYYGTITYELFQRYGVNKSYTIKTAVDGGGKVFIRATYYNFE